ncbi:MAG: helix-turn-helix transcriptional regulator [Firmicutes bacterium]|nr:helix-turn-helix transcriptional regulator [Bacillota bacterium]MDD4264635.1 helix-turn-helix transcriptional regulator [Bacillota bacterium]MDD4693288.1 helix-turn-helix transcriptional regulator [Bacillota bacterium]
MKNRDPGLASVFSFVVPGLGQIYIGKMGWGIFHFLAHIGLGIVGLTIVYPLISSEGSFVQRLVAWLGSPSNMGIAFGILFLSIGNWIWSFLTAAQKESEESESKDIAGLVEAARRDYLSEASQSANESASALEKTTSYETLVKEETKPELNSSFAATLAELMDLKGMGVKDLAEITGISELEIAGYLKGSNPDDATINILARGLNISPRFLTGHSAR